MTAPAAPRLDQRRTGDFSAELQRRARAWIPSWDLANADGDFGRALLDIAARFSAEVAERLDGAGDKLRRGFLDWLAVRGTAARPARVPVVFKLTTGAKTAVLAEAPVRLQAAAGNATVVFETEKDVRIVPGQLQAVVGVEGDAYFLAPPGLSSLDPLDSTPTRWQPRRFTAAGAATLQVDPEGGLAPGTVIEAGGQQYRVTKVEKDLVSIEPPLGADLADSEIITKVDSFTPFDSTARNWQSHALYLGDTDLLNLESDATIEVVGATALQDGFTWEYYGKIAQHDEVGWQPLRLGTADEQSAARGLVLHKPKGSVEVLAIDGKSSRWIRASRPDSSDPFTAEQLTLRINAAQCDTPPCPKDPPPAPVAAEAMANSTPLVLETTFFPLGKEPRQFDAFYLGSQEAFSKSGAKVHLCFTMADPQFAVLAALRGGTLIDNLVLAGVGADGSLHLLQFDGAGRLTQFGDARRPPTPLDPRPDFRPALWMNAGVLFTAVSAGHTVWVWVETGTSGPPTGWVSLGEVSSAAGSGDKIRGLVFLADGQKGNLFALLQTSLYRFDLNNPGGGWTSVATKDSITSAQVLLGRIAPVASQANGFGGQASEGLIAVGTDQTVYAVTQGGVCTALFGNADPGVAPAAVRRSDTRLIVVAVGAPPPPVPRTMLAFLSNPGALTQSLPLETPPLEWPDPIGESIDVNMAGGQLTFALTVGNGAARALATWAPFVSPGKTPLFRVTIPSSAGVVIGAATVLPGYVLAPTAASEVIVASYDPSRRQTFIAPPGAAIVTSTDADRLQAGDRVAYHVSTVVPRYHVEAVLDGGIAAGGLRFHTFDTPADADDVVVYKATMTPFVGATSTATPPHLNELTIDGTDNVTRNGSVLLITTDLNTRAYEVTGLNAGVATLDRNLEVVTPATPPATVNYQAPDANGAAVLPTLRLNGSSNGWDPALLDRTRLYFEGGDPAFQAGTVLPPGAAPPPALVVLGKFWVTPPPALPQGFKFLVDGALGDWTRQLADTSSNPELSWEYWNGTGWWRLDNQQDATGNLKRTGLVSFDVPIDLKPTDWSGKTNHWIRARLIGGDYGQEKITVVTTTNGNKSEQTVQRSPDGIRAPSVLQLQISYGLCKPVVPQFVLAEDSGSTRDQSDANRTGGVVVEAFVPLPVLLRGLSQPSPAGPPQGDSPAPCGCCGPSPAAPAVSPEPSPAATASGSAASPAAPAARQILIGVTGVLSGAPVNILLLVDERAHTGLAPMVVEALNGDRFQPLVVDDATRALGESGVLSLSFAIPPAPRELFGQALTWLRLTPKPGGSGTWAPVIRGAYLNAVFASATETLTRELLGSSEGAPNLTLRVARPPVLHNTLELRVREPLGDEERDRLREADKSVVVSDDVSLDGDWVRWTRVIDPADEGPGDRVYALDEAIGEVRFGDGLHGMIPPIGTDSIVAFSYKRTEPPLPGTEDVPANAITVRTPFNLVSPVESVESVIAADQAAGGAPPEPDERVLRFGFARLRHRNRAVTANDLEDIALQSSPDIVQARCLIRRTGLRLVVVMKGRSPAPTAAQVRELRRLLLDAAPASLGAPGALTIVGPAVRKLRVDLTLRVEHLDVAGDVERDVAARLAAFFDTGTGAVDRSGWPLGASPTEDDIALALLDTPKLESIGLVTVLEQGRDGADTAWPSTLKATELAVLADDPLRIQFETSEVLA